MLEVVNAMLAFIPFQYLKLFSVEFAILIGAIIGLISFQMRNRTVNIEDISKINKLLSDQMNALISQTKQLSEELSRVRDELMAAHSVIDKMRKEINSLEDSIRKYQTHEKEKPQVNDQDNV